MRCQQWIRNDANHSLKNISRMLFKRIQRLCFTHGFKHRMHNDLKMIFKPWTVSATIKTRSWKPKRNLNLQQPNLNSNYTHRQLQELDYFPTCDGGATHATPRQKWQSPWFLLSHLVQRGVNWFGPHVSSGMRCSAKQKSQKQPVIKPQSTHARKSKSWSPCARTCIVTSVEAALVLGVCDVDQSFGPSFSCELFVPDLANFISQMADSINCWVS